MSKDKLRELAADLAAVVERERVLRKQSSFPPSFPSERADWFLAGVESYLAGKQPSLDHALSLVRRRGKPKAKKPSGPNYERAKKIFWMRGPGPRPEKSWLKIADEFPEADVRDLQRELKRYTPDIVAEIAEEVSRRLGH